MRKNKPLENFAHDFAAASVCEKKNTGGVTGWYLPAKDELQALYNAYQTNKTAIDAGLAGNGYTAFPTIDDFWSSTEYSSTTLNAWQVDFSNGDTGINGKSGSYFVRCVRDL